MTTSLLGLHHVTATVAEAQPDVDFYTRALGLRLVKKTVNFDNSGVYHFYYGNQTGTPGTLFTTFPYAGHNVRRGVIGAGQIAVTAFSVPCGAVDGWRERLGGLGIDGRLREGSGSRSLQLRDPSGLIIELVESEDARTPWLETEVPTTMAITGLDHVTLHVRTPELTREFLERVLGFSQGGEEHGCGRLGVGGGGPGRRVEVAPAAREAPLGVNGLGTVHHVAFAIGTDDEQQALREQLLGHGVKVTEVLDRQYFRSIYFREPGGVLYEVATTKPGFLIDENVEDLGRGLKLPPWEEPRRAAILEGLVPLT